jgi:hypothetical protein
LNSERLLVVRSASGSARYIAWGRNYRSLAGILDYLPGLRGRVEYHFLKHAPRALHEVTELVPDHMKSSLTTLGPLAANYRAGLLLATSYYKKTVAVGPVLDTAGTRLFIRRHANSSDCESEVAACNSLHITESDFRTLAPIKVDDLTVGYDVVRRSRPTRARDAVASAAALHESLLGSRIIGRIVDQFTTTQVERLLKEADMQLGESLSRDMLVQLGQDRELFLTHGDVTRWNVLIDEDHRYVLIDYESVGYRPKYYDVVHALTQEAALRGSRVDLADVQRRASNATGNSVAHDDISLVLLRSLLETCTSLVAYPSNASRLNKTLTSRMRLYADARQ